MAQKEMRRKERKKQMGDHGSYNLPTGMGTVYKLYCWMGAMAWMVGHLSFTFGKWPKKDAAFIGQLCLVPLGTFSRRESWLFAQERAPVFGAGNAFCMIQDKKEKERYPQ